MGSNVSKYNLFSYCNNSPINFVDSTGTSPLQVVLAAICGIIGFMLADYIARSMGLAPTGKGFWNATKYYAFTAAVAIGGAALGWFAGGLIIKATVRYLIKNPNNVVKLATQCGGKLFLLIMSFLGINPFDYITDPGKLTALARALNSSWFALPESWARSFCKLADKWGRDLFFHSPHGRYTYHIHLSGQQGQKLEDLHFQVTKAVWEFLKKLFG